MTVTASPQDTLGYGEQFNPVGRGQLLLNGIAAQQALVNAPTNQNVKASQLAQLNALQMEAVDYFMASYWVSADQILATMPPPTTGRFGGYVSSQLTSIATRAAQVAALIAAGTPVSPIGNLAPQYSRAYPPSNSAYPLQGPDVFLYGLQTQLVDFLMATQVTPAWQILATMTGAQTWPYNYVSNYTWYSTSSEEMGI